MDIGTAKLPLAERRGIPHHQLDVLEVTEEASVAAYQPAPGPTSPRSPGAGGTPVLVGGSGLYVRAALDRPRDPAHRPGGPARGSRRRPLASAPRRCCSGCASSTRRRRRRSRPTTPDASCAPSRSSSSPVARSRRRCRRREYVRPTVPIGLELPRARPRRADRRAGAPDVVARAWLTRSGPWSRWACARAAPPRGPSATPRRWPQIDGDLTEDEALAQTATLTRRLARRQESWFRPDPRITWLDARRARHAWSGPSRWPGRRSGTMAAMADQLPFTKGHGTENDFVLVPDLEGALDLTAQPGRPARRPPRGHRR